MHTVSTTHARTAATSPVLPPKLTAVQRREQKKLADELRARQDAAAWAEAQHPQEVRYLARLGLYGTRCKPWRAVPSFHSLESILKANGREYAAAFLDEVDVRWQWLEQAWRHVTYTAGVTDGQRWAVSFATPDQLDRLRSALRNSGRWLLIDAKGRNQLELTVTEGRDRDLPAAHWLLTWILGCDVYRPRVINDADEDGYEEFEYDSGNQEFKSFWQPFFAEPMEEVLESLEIGTNDVKCKLMETDYIQGFIDGATGLSEQLRAHYLD